MSEPAVITAGTVVLFHYTLTVDGAVVDTSRDRGEPLVYLHGSGNIVVGLEQEMEGKAVGDAFQVAVAPEDGYGVSDGPGPQRVPRKEFPKDVAEGMSFFAETSSGQRVQLWVTKVEGAGVWVDTNHPLADKTLNFDVEIMRIRSATSEEMAHGHPHGPDGTGGHHHHH